jgi:hypothetical protein
MCVLHCNVCGVLYLLHQVKAKFKQRGVEIAAQLYTCTTTDADEGLMIDILRLEVFKLAFCIHNHFLCAARALLHIAWCYKPDASFASCRHTVTVEQ